MGKACIDTAYFEYIKLIAKIVNIFLPFVYFLQFLKIIRIKTGDLMFNERGREIHRYGEDKSDGLVLIGNWCHFFLWIICDTFAYYACILCLNVLMNN